MSEASRHVAVNEDAFMMDAYRVYAYECIFTCTQSEIALIFRLLHWFWHLSCENHLKHAMFCTSPFCLLVDVNILPELWATLKSTYVMVVAI